MTRPRRLLSILLGLTLGGLLSCQDGADGASQCRDVGTAICADACACDDCAIQGSDGTTTLTFDDAEGCRMIYVELLCDEAALSIDLDACQANLVGAGCVEAEDDIRALALPASCE